MAKKLNETKAVASLADSEYIVVTMSDGSIGRIKKDDLYAVVTDSTAGIVNSAIYRNIPLGSSVGRNQLVLINKSQIWGRMVSTISVCNPTGTSNGMVLLSASLYSDSKIQVGANKIVGTIPSVIKFLYRLENSYLCLYLYCNVTNTDNYGILINSNRFRPELIGTVDDITGYTEIPI